MQLYNNKTNYSLFLLFGTILSIVLLRAIPIIFHENMVAYSATEINFFDKSYFPNNIDVNLNLDSISPRLYSLFFISTIMSLGLSYEWTYILIYLLTCFFTTLSIYIYAVRTTIKNNPTVLVIISFFIAYSTIGCYAGFFTFNPDSLFLGLGTSFVTLAIVQVLTIARPTNVPYCLAALAGMFHVHEGIWGFVIVTSLLLVKKRFAVLKDWGLYVAIASILITVLPSVVTTKGGISSELFNDIYVIFRAPHHLYFWESFPYQFPAQIISYYIIYKILNLYNANSEDIIYCKFAGLLFLLSIILWFVGCELLQLSLFSKLYIPKFIKYINIVYTLLFCKAISNSNARKISLLLLLSSSLVPNHYIVYIFALPSLLLFLLLEINVKVRRHEKILCFSLIIMNISASFLMYPIVVVITLFMIVVILYKNLDFRNVTILLYFCILVLIIDSFKFVPDLTLTDSLIANKTNKDFILFSKQVSTIVPKDEVILADPKDIASGYLQHIARRDVFVLFKAAPSNEKGLPLWYNRLNALSEMESWKPNDYLFFMAKEHINYLVINENLTKICLSESFEEKLRKGKYVLYKNKKL